MRIIEKNMNAAIARGANFSSANTQVLFQDLHSARVYLHGHEIAIVSYNGSVAANLETLRAYPTNTTKSRLRALGVNVYTRKGVTYINDKAI
jgi:hypothetical protein